MCFGREGETRRRDETLNGIKMIPFDDIKTHLTTVSLGEYLKVRRGKHTRLMRLMASEERGGQKRLCRVAGEVGEAGADGPCSQINGGG